MKKKKRKVQILTYYKDQVLLFKTNKKRGQFWQNITGSVDKDESYIKAAIREFQEESSIKLSDIKNISKLKLKFLFTDKWDRKVKEKVFVIELNNKPEVKIDPKEHEDYQWIDIKKIDKNTYKYNSNYKVFKRVLL